VSSRDCTASISVAALCCRSDNRRFCSRNFENIWGVHRQSELLKREAGAMGFEETHCTRLTSATIFDSESHSIIPSGALAVVQTL